MDFYVKDKDYDLQVPSQLSSNDVTVIMGERLVGTPNQIIVTQMSAPYSIVKLSAAQSISPLSSPSFASLFLTNFSNQLRFGTGNTITLNSVVPTSSRTYTIPDVGLNASFVMTEGKQVINGQKIFDSIDVKTINGISFDSIISGLSNIIIYRPGAGPHVNPSLVYPTWTEIKNIITQNEGAVIVYIDNSLGVPIIDSNTNFYGKCILRGLPLKNKVQLKINDGVIITDLSRIESLDLVGNFTTVPFQYTGLDNVLTLGDISSLKFDGPSAKPFIELTGSQSLQIIPVLSALPFHNFLSIVTPIINLLGTSQLEIISYSTGWIFDNTVAGVVGTSLLYNVNASAKIGLQFNMFGTITTTLADDAKLVKFNDALYYQYNADNVQDALNQLKIVTSPRACSLGRSYGGAPVLINLSNAGPVQLNTGANSIDDYDGISPVGDAIRLSSGLSGKYKITGTITYINTGGASFDMGVCIGDQFFGSLVLSNIRAHDASSAPQYCTLTVDTVMINPSQPSVYVYIYAIGSSVLPSAIDIYSWNLSVITVKNDV